MLLAVVDHLMAAAQALVLNNLILFFLKVNFSCKATSIVGLFISNSCRKGNNGLSVILSFDRGLYVALVCKTVDSSACYKPTLLIDTYK